MTRREMAAAGFGLVLCITVSSLACAAQPAAKAGDTGQEVVATFDGQQITAAELDDLAAAQLVRLKQQMYDARRQALEQEIYQRLLTKAAEEAGVSVDEYRQQQLDAMAAAPTEDEIKKVLDQYRSRLDKDDEKARKQVVDYLTQQSHQKAEAALKDKLFQDAGVHILISPPRLEATVQPYNPTQGPADAPVTLIEYTDFQCPFCSRVQPTLDQLRATYGDRVRFVFKNLPLPMHAQSRVAAEAGLCAADQGKFWPLHDWMFANHSDLSREAIMAAAPALGIDAAALGACIDNKTHAAEVQQDMNEARSFGINGTPGFLINGRLVSGAQPFAEFANIINDELTKAGVDIPEPKPAEEDAKQAKPAGDTKPEPAVS